MPRADVPIGRCKAVIHERRLAKRGAREPNNVKDDGTNKPCAFYSGFCGEKNPIYGRKKGAKDKQPRRPKRAGALLDDLRKIAKDRKPLLQDPKVRNQMLGQIRRETGQMGAEDARDRVVNYAQNAIRAVRPTGGMILPSGREVGDLSPAFAREVPSVGRNLVAPQNSGMGVGTQLAWNMPYGAVSRPFGLGYFAQ
jgi:hypothetical protein